MPRAIIFVNGEIPNSDMARSIIQPKDILIAADGGARRALEIGVIPTVIIGDLDSLSEPEVRVFIEMGVQILRYSPAKDETDFELALLHALQAGCHPIIVVAALGGRLDQTLANIALLSAPESIQNDVRLDDGLTEAFFIINQANISGKVGDTVSLLPWGVSAEGVSTQNLTYPLREETLFPHRTRGISNVMLAETASISLKRGLLLCVHSRQV